VANSVDTGDSIGRLQQGEVGTSECSAAI